MIGYCFGAMIVMLMTCALFLNIDWPVWDHPDEGFASSGGLDHIIGSAAFSIPECNQRRNAFLRVS